MLLCHHLAASLPKLLVPSNCVKLRDGVGGDLLETLLPAFSVQAGGLYRDGVRGQLARKRCGHQMAVSQVAVSRQGHGEEEKAGREIFL